MCGLGPGGCPRPSPTSLQPRPPAISSFIKAAGPARLSFADRGISLATNGRRALCVRFVEAVPGIDPTGLSSRILRHPGATLTVADPEALLADLRAAGAKID